MSNIKQTVPEIIAILDDAIDNFTNSKYAHYWSYLQSRGLYRQRLNFYVNTKPNKQIKSKMYLLRDLQEQKLIEGVLNKRSDVKDIGSMFLLKCKFGYIEEDKRQQNEIAREKIEKEKELDGVGKQLDIKFTIAKHRSDEDIQTLIDSAE